MANRYDGVREAINREEMYKEHMERRGVKFIKQFKTFHMRHPTAKQIGALEMIGHTWSLGDRYYKLAHKYYGDSEYWWVIAQYNQKPTENHIQNGDIIVVPMPLRAALKALGH